MDTGINILENIVMRETHSRQRAQLLACFPRLVMCSHQNFLALRKYVTSTPQRFYDKDIYSDFLSWLNDRDARSRADLKAYFADHTAELNLSFHHLSEINAYDWHDDYGKLDDYDLIRFVDQQINPTYLRLVEAVFAPLLRVVAYFSRIDRGKSTESLDVYNVVEEVKRTNLSSVVTPYEHIMRNGIAHGGIAYLDSEIRYKDKQGNERAYRNADVVRTFDDMVDACNALTLALSVFLLSNQDKGYDLLQQLLLEELSEETRTPWWEVIGCTPSAYAHLNQLVLHIRVRSLDYSNVLLSTFQSGVLAEKFAPGYNRYFLSMRSESSGPGFAALDGQKLRKLRIEGNATLKDYQGVVQDNLVYFVPRYRLPRFVLRIGAMLTFLRQQWPFIAADFRKQLGRVNLTVRNISIHRKSWGCVVSGSIYVASPSAGISINQDHIRKSCRRMIRNALDNARRSTSRLSLLRYLPLGYARISLFCEDSRKRELFGLESNLIGTIQVQRFGQINTPDIIGATIEKRGKYRIAWNRAWLDHIDTHR